MAAQLDCEGINDSKATQFDLIEHFQKNGLSENALNKIKKDILSGGMKVDLLCERTYDEIVEMCKDYGFSVLQQKAFIKVVKLLPNSNANNDSDNNSKGTPQEQVLSNDIKMLSTKVSNYKNKCQEIDLKNKSAISNTCDKLVQYGNKIKESVDIIINKLIEKV